MSFYFFRFIGGRAFTDPEGLDCADVEEARAEAVRRALRAWQAGVDLGENRRDWRVDVLDDCGNRVLGLPFADALDEA